MPEQPLSKRILVWEIIALLATAGLWLHMERHTIEDASLRQVLPRIDSSKLLLGEKAAGMGVAGIFVHEPEEFDYKTRTEILELRSQEVRKYAHLIEGDYKPSETLFGQITDGKPWWGLTGQYCNGPGERSIEGLSEESRFLLNPFLLLGVNEIYAWTVEGPCFPVYPRVLSLIWDAPQRTATVVYDMNRYFKELDRLPVRYYKPAFYPVNYNARDFGLNYFVLSRAGTSRITMVNHDSLFTEPSDMRAFIHTGGSCGFPGGCNNQSPLESHLDFRVDGLPAVMEWKLWEERPSDIQQPADFIYRIRFE